MEVVAEEGRMLLIFAFIAALGVGVIGYRAATGYRTDLPQSPPAVAQQLPAEEATPDMANPPPG